MSASKNCMTRLQKEHKAFLKDPPPGIRAHPNPQNILEWHYVLEGHKDSPFEGGVYHGKVLFHPQYPFKAPGIMMLTPNGRFQTGQRLCLSMSDYHPETWNPLWSIGTILTGLMSFMYENEITAGAVNFPVSERRKLAASSLETNLKNPMFRELFPEYVQIHADREKAKELRALQNSQSRPLSPTSNSPGGSQSVASYLTMIGIAVAVGCILLIPLVS